MKIHFALGTPIVYFLDLLDTTTIDYKVEVLLNMQLYF